MLRFKWKNKCKSLLHYPSWGLALLGLLLGQCDVATLYLADSLAISNTQFIYLYLDVYKGEASCLTPSPFRAITSSPLASMARCIAWLVGDSLAGDVSKILHNLIRPKASLV